MNDAFLKETKNERFARLEAVRLAQRPEPRWCDRCHYRTTSRVSGLCRGCENPESLGHLVDRWVRAAKLDLPW